MSIQEEKKESFEDFKKSFTYGKRSDLNFKFLSHLSDEEAADFIQILLWKLGDAMNDGDWNQIVNHIIEGQIKAYSRTSKVNYPDGPFIAMPKDIAMAKLALITSSGHFVDGDDPQPLGIPNMTQKEAEKRIMDFLKEEPTLSIIPKTTIIAVASFRDVLAAMNTPRILITKHPMGRPIGQPNDKDGQFGVVKAALDLFHEARALGTLKEYVETYNQKIL